MDHAGEEDARRLLQKGILHAPLVIRRLHAGKEGNAGPFLSGVNTNDIKWGDSSSFGTPQNELRFTGSTFNSTTDTPFRVGSLFYFNGTSATNTGITGTDLKATLVFTAPAGIGTQSFTFEIPITATANTADPVASADYITLATSFPNENFILGGKTYTLSLTGFGNVDASNGFLANNNTELHVFEGKGGGADLFGKVTLAPTATRSRHSRWRWQSARWAWAGWQ